VGPGAGPPLAATAAVNPVGDPTPAGVDPWVAIPVALALLSLIVFVHEFGHFFVARRVGVHVREFALGFPPRLASWIRGGEHVSAVALSPWRPARARGPLRPLVVDRVAPDEGWVRGAVALLTGDHVLVAADLQRLAATGSAGAILFGASVESALELDRWRTRIPVVRVSAADGERLAAAANQRETLAEIRLTSGGGTVAALRVGGTRFSLNAVPLGGYVRLTGESDEFDAPGSFFTRPRWQRALVLVAGPLMNFALAPFLFFGAALIADVAGVEILQVAPGSPAEMADLWPGDRLLSIADVAIDLPPDVPRAVQAHLGEPIAIVVERAGARRTMAAIPRVSPPAGQGALGIRVGAYAAPLSIDRAVPRAFTYTGEAILLLPRAIREAIQGVQPIQLAGPVGIVDAVGQAARQGPEVVFFLAGLLSAQIGLINLIPWPGLDGGRLAFVGLEAITRRRLPPRREAAFHFAGIVLLLTLAVIISIGDVQRLVGG